MHNLIWKERKKKKKVIYGTDECLVDFSPLLILFAVVVAYMTETEGEFKTFKKKKKFK